MVDLGDLDDDFKRYLILSKQMIANLEDKDDRFLCAEWILKLCSIESGDEHKKNRNAYMKRLLLVLRDGVLDGPFQEPPPPGPLPLCGILCDVEVDKTDDALVWLEREVLQRPKIPHFTSRWSPDRRTYVAISPLPGRGALIYMAVAKDPEEGWDIPGKRSPF